LEKKKINIELKFPIIIYTVDDDGYIIEELEIENWDWHDDALRIFIKESA